MLRSKSSLFLAPIVLATVVGCSSSDDGASANNTVKVEDSLEIFSWWTSGGESEALQTYIDGLNAKFPKLTITNAAATDPDTARARLADRMAKNEPPDSFQAIAGVDLMSYVDAGKMEPITALAKAQHWDTVFPKAVLDVVSKNGEIYAVPANIERDNNLYYNKTVLSAHGIANPPKSLAEFHAACATLQKDGITPLSTPAAGWVLSLVAFETLMPGKLGGEYYNAFFKGEKDPNAQELRDFFTELDAVLKCSNVVENAQLPTAGDRGRWDRSADVMVDGKAAMYVMGDWAKGYFEGLTTPFKDFGVVAGLGSDGYYTFNSATFGLPKQAQHPEAAKQFLTIVGSKDGQTNFNLKKGSVPARPDADMSKFDDMVTQSQADFNAAADQPNKLLPGYAALTTNEFQNQINPSLLVFAVGGALAKDLLGDSFPAGEEAVVAGDVDYIVQKVASNYALLQQ